MKLRDIMTQQVIRIRPEESLEVAARVLTRYNIGILPVCGSDGKLCGLVTDRDMVTRCLASGRSPANTTVGEVMTRSIIAARPDTEASVAAEQMGRCQIRRLPVMENGRLCGMVSLADLAGKEERALLALEEVSSNVSGNRRNVHK